MANFFFTLFFFMNHIISTGKPTCGDIDILLYPPESSNETESKSIDDSLTDTDNITIIHHLVNKLTEIKFLTDHLSLPGDESKHDGRGSYMGICKLPRDNSVHRRIDIKTYPRRYAAFAMLYFTGSDHFNRSMRSYADRTGFKLTVVLILIGSSYFLSYFMEYYRTKGFFKLPEQETKMENE
jgi:DNA polymerase/3'-5' exonuclease PolX